jgi:hypothetical protein
MIDISTSDAAADTAAAGSVMGISGVESASSSLAAQSLAAQMVRALADEKLELQRQVSRLESALPVSCRRTYLNITVCPVIASVLSAEGCHYIHQMVCFHLLSPI